MPRAPEEQIAQELHELNRTMKVICNLLQRFIGVQHIPKQIVVTDDDSQEKQSL